MKRLILMRHAKSDWSRNHVDIDRPLNLRGERTARTMGKWLREHGYLPDTALCSDAVRTRQTLALLGLDLPTDFSAALYMAEAPEMLQALRAASGDTVLLVGHNPGIGNLANALVARVPRHDRWSDYPTCATLVADFDIADWRDLTLTTGTVVQFTVGRDLTD